MTRRSGLAAAAVLALALAVGARAEEGDGGSPADSTSVPPDSTAAAADASADAGAPADSTAARKLLSTDGSILVYEEAEPGEGIDGFWWEYDPLADLERFLDDDLRDRPRDPLVDGFGFTVVMPESIAALRDSVRAVADSILADRIDLDVRFDPRMKSRYVERKDQYILENSLDGNVPVSSRGSITTSVKNKNEFNESTRKVKEDRSLSAAFNYRFRDGMNASLTVNQNDLTQEREKTLETESANRGMNGRFRSANDLPGVGKLESTVGLSVNENAYQTQRTEGSTLNVSPSWGLKTTTVAGPNTVVLDYTGNSSRGDREEILRITTPTDSGEVTIEEEKSSSDKNRSDKLSTSIDTKFDEKTTLRITGLISRDRQQFISQVDSLAGLQETRTTENRSLKARFTSSPLPNLQVRADGDLNLSKRDYVLDVLRFSRTTKRSARLEFDYDPWAEGRFTVKLNRSHDENDFRTIQAGIVESRKAQIDYKQGITDHVRFDGGYLISLDRKAFDDTDLNSNDRDLQTQRGSFTVRYAPVTEFSSALKMEIRQQESVNIHPTKSGDNKTDFTYLIVPTYTLKIGKANLTGDFTADAKYAVFDFDEDRNNLTRRFSTRQRWQQAITPRLSTEVSGTYEFSDEGAYSRSGPDEKRLFSRTREVRRFNVESKVLYNPTKGLRATISYRRYGDDQYSVEGDERTLTSEPRTQEFTAGVQWKKKFLRNVSLDIDLSQTQKEGDRVNDIEKRFYLITVLLEYQPFARGD